MTLLVDPERFATIVPQDAALIVDTTASLQVLAAEMQSEALDQSPTRLARVVMYGRGVVSRFCLKGQVALVGLMTSRLSCSSAAGLCQNFVRRLPVIRRSRRAFL